jgi:chemotaxis family two-component system sensor kinase Cph1
MMSDLNWHDLVASCEREPIAHVGMIQPHGILVSTNDSGIIDLVSENSLQLGYQPHELLGRSAAEEFAPFTSHHELQRCLSKRQSIVLDFQRPEAIRSMALSVTPTSGRVFFEFEPQFEGQTWEDASNRLSYQSLPQEFQSMEDACQELAETIQRMTGYDHVMVYRFFEDWSGEVIAEARTEESAPTYRHMRFPASDIPKNARQLYQKNPLRMIPHVDYRPYRLLTSGSFSESSIDLTMAQLRSVSPLHLEYLRNMQVTSSLSFSILFGNQLWGLVNCHHRQPRWLHPLLRNSATQWVHTFSLGLRSFIAVQENRTHFELDDDMALLSRNVHWTTSGLSLDGGCAQQLLDIMGACGFAFCNDQDIYRWGETPDEETIQKLWDPLQIDQTRQSFATDCIRDRYRSFEHWDQPISGLLIDQVRFLPSPGQWSQAIIWFRKEWSSSIAWAGQPEKLVRTNAQGELQLHPRRSFQAWKEQTKGRSQAWSVYEKIASRKIMRFLSAVIPFTASTL